MYIYSIIYLEKHSSYIFLGICIGAPPEMEPLMNHTDDDDDRKKYIEDFLREGEAPPTNRFVN